MIEDTYLDKHFFLLINYCLEISHCQDKLEIFNNNLNYDSKEYSAPWGGILGELKRRGISSYLYNIIFNYFHNRMLYIEENSLLQTTYTVPQDSAIKSTLLNVFYPTGVTLIRYADDIGIMVTAKTAGMLELTSQHAHYITSQNDWSTPLYSSLHQSSWIPWKRRYMEKKDFWVTSRKPLFWSLEGCFYQTVPSVCKNSTDRPGSDKTDYQYPSRQV